MRKIVAILLMSLLSGRTLVVAEGQISPRMALAVERPCLGPTGGILMATAVREATRLAHLEDLAAQTRGTQGNRSGGHPVLIGAVVGAGVGAVLGAVAISCTDSALQAGAFGPPLCGSEPKARGALLGAGVGAGLGALIGLAFRH